MAKITKKRQENSVFRFPKILLATLICLLAVIFLAYKIYPRFYPKTQPVEIQPDELGYFSVEELKKYDGSNPDLPIYMGYEGNVYDVTPGKSFYEKGATYNYLTGRDATKELNEVGVGEIIVRKYKVIGKIQDSN